jgi:hypothetical protein
LSFSFLFCVAFRYSDLFLVTSLAVARYTSFPRYTLSGV